MKIRLGELKRIIREECMRTSSRGTVRIVEAHDPGEVGAALADLLRQAKSGTATFPLAGTVVVGGQPFDVKIVQDVDGKYGKQGDYFGLVNGGNYGGGKTPVTALGKAKKRIEFLLSSANVQTKRADPGEQEARMADAELRRREKRGF